MRRAVAAVLSAALLTACSGEGGAEVTPSSSPSPSPSPTPSATPSPTPEVEFAREVEELYTLVEESVRGSGDLAASSQVLRAFATSVALIRVAEESEPDRQRIVDAAEVAADAYLAASGITFGIERASAVDFARSRLQAIEEIISALPR